MAEEAAKSAIPRTAQALEIHGSYLPNIVTQGRKKG
jgi:hypothetical protein